MFNFLLFLLVFITKTSDSYHINLRNVQTIPNLELLGSSYSTINKANNDKNAGKGSNHLETEGVGEKDIHTRDGKNNVIDVTNLKNSVIDIKMMNKLNNTLEYVHSDNVYIQNYPRCEILNENKLKDEKEEESVVFSKKSIKGNHQVNTKIIFCSKFIIGLNDINRFNHQFLSDLRKLKNNLNSCAKNENREHHSKDCVFKEYMKFFELYGTHYIVKIVLGGKIVIDENLSSGSSSESKNLDLNLGVLRYLDKKSNSKNSNLNDRNIRIFGGTVWDDNWYSELKTDPAPLKFTLATYNEIFKEYNINYKHYISSLKKHLKVR